jgi:hypothetical protein
MARELFSAGFVSCWSELDPASQEQLVRSLEAALASPTIPPGVFTGVSCIFYLLTWLETTECSLCNIGRHAIWALETFSRSVDNVLYLCEHPPQAGLISHTTGY